MLPPTRASVWAPPDDPPLEAIANELRATYAEAFRAAHLEATEFDSRHETPDGTQIDPTAVGDLAGCRAVTAIIAATVGRHLPAARLIERLDDNPAVIDSSWHHPATGRSFIVEWNYDRPFGDPAGLTVAEVIR